MKSKGAHSTFHDPIVEHQERYEGQGAASTADWRSKVSESDLIIVGTNWPEYRDLVVMDSEGRLKGKTVFDSKRLFHKREFPHATYFTIG